MTTSNRSYKPLRVYDGTGWTCDVDLPMWQWTILKRHARKSHMKVAAFTAQMIDDYAKRKLAEPKGN